MTYVGIRVFGYLKKNLGYLKTNLGENHQRYKAFKTFSRWNLSILLLALIQISFINIDDYGHYISFDEKIRYTIKTLIYIIISSLINLNFDSYYKLKNEDIATNNQGRIFVKNDLETNPPQDVIIPPLARIRSSGSFSAKSSASSESIGQQFYTTVEELGDGREAVVSLKQLTFDEILFSLLWNDYYFQKYKLLLFTSFNPFNETTPPHFYGELTKTEEGCQLLREKGHFCEFANYIREHKMENKDRSIITKLKSILWAIGNIGSSKSGLQFLEEENIITNIKCIAENSSVLSLKGFTASGVEILEELEWESVYDPDTGVGTGLCIPMNSQAFLSFPKWNYKGFYNPADKLIKPLSSSNNQIERDLLKAMSNLTNRILSSTGSRALAKTHRGSDGVIAIMSEDQNDTFAEEIVPKQDLLPKIIVKGFNL
ncbi:6236_t:CDS:2 [Entrophospora sp. SA101]|nr:6236_t:CDS:2 [Entrophospora sp. SA101]